MSDNYQLDTKFVESIKKIFASLEAGQKEYFLKINRYWGIYFKFDEYLNIYAVHDGVVVNSNSKAIPARIKRQLKFILERGRMFKPLTDKENVS